MSITSASRTRCPASRLAMQPPESMHERGRWLSRGPVPPDPHQSSRTVCVSHAATTHPSDAQYDSPRLAVVGRGVMDHVRHRETRASPQMARQPGSPGDSSARSHAHGPGRPTAPLHEVADLAREYRKSLAAASQRSRAGASRMTRREAWKGCVTDDARASSAIDHLGRQLPYPASQAWPRRVEGWRGALKVPAWLRPSFRLRARLDDMERPARDRKIAG
jgi:hypothetical protein